MGQRARLARCSASVNNRTDASQTSKSIGRVGRVAASRVITSTSTSASTSTSTSTRTCTVLVLVLVLVLALVLVRGLA